MKEFSEYIEKQGVLFLNDITFTLLTLQGSSDHTRIVLCDHLTTELIDNQRQLKIIFTRSISYDPKSLYDLSVSFGAIYTLKTDIAKTNDMESLDFRKMLLDNQNGLFLNVIRRISQLISQITSSHGAPPIVTPPIYIAEYQS